MLCTKLVFCWCFDILNNICTQHVLNLYVSGDSVNNLLSYCGLTDSRMRASDTDLPVTEFHPIIWENKRFSFTKSQSKIQQSAVFFYPSHRFFFSNFVASSENIWYFVHKIVLVIKKNFEPEGREFANFFEITRTIYLNSERSVQFLKQNVEM